MNGPVERIADTLQAATATFVKEHRLPGAVAGIVHEGRLAWWGSVGFADVAERRPAGPATMHRIASITKTVTATAVLQLRDAGALDLDDPLVRHIPELRAARNAFAPWEHVTLRLVLSHQSGLMSEPPGADWMNGQYEGDVLRSLARAAEISASVPVSTQEKYSNLGYQLLGEVVARVSGLPFQAYARTRILQPLGMRRTDFEPLPDPLRDDVATPYAGRWMSDELPVAPDSPMSSSEGGLWSCVDDLVRWLAFALETDDGPGHPEVLSLETRREMHRPRYLADDTWTSAFGLGWYGVRQDGVTWVQHGGSLFGFRSTVCFDPRERVGAVVLLNGMGRPATLAMSLGALARTAVAEAAPVVTAPAPMPADYADLLGIYADVLIGGELLRLEWRDGKLTVVDPAEDEFRPTLRPTGEPDTFVVEPGYRWSGETVRFLRADDGRVRAASLPGQVLPRFDARD
ncbi:MAG: serine hydrolase [Actinomycetales bacterium]|nr:serine hydrolase [Actinomycetales bacterium]